MSYSYHSEVIRQTLGKAATFNEGPGIAPVGTVLDSTL